MLNARNQNVLEYLLLYQIICKWKTATAKDLGALMFRVSPTIQIRCKFNSDYHLHRLLRDGILIDSISEKLSYEYIVNGVCMMTHISYRSDYTNEAK